VNRASDQFFPRASLSAEKHRGLRIRHFGDGFIDLKHLGGSPDDVFELVLVQKFAPIMFVFLDEPSLFQGSLDGKFDLIQLERLADVVVGSFPDGLDGGLNRSEGGDHNHRGVRCVPFEESEHFHPVFLSHPHIGDDDVEKVIRPLGDGFFAA
jgi:hypothetical protein